MAGELVSNVKILKGYLYADVRLGCTDHDVVTTSVRVATAGPEVQEALGPLYELLRTRALDLAGQAMNAQHLQEVRDQASREIMAGVKAKVEEAAKTRINQIDEAIHVARSVGRVRHGEDWHTGDRRRTSLKKLQDTIRQAVGY